MQEAFREAAESHPGSDLARDVGEATQRSKQDKHIQFLDNLGGDWKGLGSRVFQWEYVPGAGLWHPFWELERDLSRLHTVSIGLSPNEQTDMLTHFASGLRLSEEGVDPAIRKICRTRTLTEVLADPNLIVSDPTLSPVSDLFLHHYTYLSGNKQPASEALRGYVLDSCVRQGFTGYIGLTLVLPAAAEWIWRR